MNTNLRIKKLLHTYEQTSGQQLNPDKTTMCFNKNISSSSRMTLMSLWSNNTSQQYERYLSLPPFIERSKVELFLISRTECGKKYKFEKRNSYLKVGRKYYWKQLLHPSLYIPWVVLSSLTNFAWSWRVSWPNFGRDNKATKKGSIGMDVINYVLQSFMDGWALRT